MKKLFKPSKLMVSESKSVKSSIEAEKQYRERLQNKLNLRFIRKFEQVFSYETSLMF
jgi:hypothetical protein